MLDAWDGLLPKTHKIETGGGRALTPILDLDEEVTLKIAPSEEDVMGWDIRWRFPASGNANSCLFEFHNIKVQSVLEPSGECFSTVGYKEQEASKAALLKTAEAEVNISIIYNDEASYDVGGGVRNCRIFKLNRRILVWDSPDPRFGEELVERNLPLAGPFYILSSQQFRGPLERYLSNEKLSFEQLPVGGLPNGWGLCCLTNAARLTREQRIWLTEGDALLESSARIRFVGGRPIIRGGTKLYAFYDLPTLELEAPHSTTPESDGLDFQEIVPILINRNPSPIRRFSIVLRDKIKNDFLVKAIHGDEKLAVVKFRVSMPDGAGIGSERSFSLDSFGRSINSDEGLRGAKIRDLPNFDIEQNEEWIVLNSSSCLTTANEKYLRENIAANLLDSLGQLGSIAYGVARDQIRRMADIVGLEIQPALLLLKLRCAGHLEIETDRRGHMVRIHMVRPTIYTLPVKYAGKILFGVCGSLRLQNWIDLINQKTVVVFVEEQTIEYFSTLRLACESFEIMQEFAKSQGFQFTHRPSYTIVNWAGSLEIATSELSNWGWGNLAANLSQLQRLHPDSAQFTTISSGLLTVDSATGRQLFRLDDPSVQGLQVYVLGSVQEDRSVSFSFIHDSKWGIWISISAFAAMLKKYYSIDEGCPWPLHYEKNTGCFWLPARLRPPSVVERVLTLCSGAGPLEFSVTGGTKIDNKIQLINAQSGETIGQVNLVYSRLTTGTWLCYRWVPRTIADRIACLLGGEIKSIAI